MYDHLQTQENMRKLSDRGVSFFEPDCGELACGWRGKGRLASAAEIYHEVRRVTSPRDLEGKKVLISAGPTREAIDPVRYISNRSSGKMGLALAREAYRRGAQVCFVEGPGLERAFLPRGVRRTKITSALELRQAVHSQLTTESPDIVIMAAAVADYRPMEPSASKVKKGSLLAPIALSPNPDILQEIGELKGSSPRPLLVGFAVETGSLEALAAEARRKLDRKNADLIIGNLAEDAFYKDTNKVVIVNRSGVMRYVDTAAKSTIAREILDVVVSPSEIYCGCEQ
jgi:phosphopantothenoylcysteine decarboxylase/phosphopantothenate--cysteine ligase